MIRKLLVCLVALIAGCTCSFAEQNSPKLAVVVTSGNVSADEISAVAEKMVTTIKASKRLSVTNATEEFVRAMCGDGGASSVAHIGDGKLVEIARSLGYDYVAVAELSARNGGAYAEMRIMIVASEDILTTREGMVTGTNGKVQPSAVESITRRLIAPLPQ